MKNLRDKKNLSVLIASWLILSNPALTCAVPYYYGWDVDNNEKYSNNESAISSYISISEDHKTVETHISSRLGFRARNNEWRLYGGRSGSDDGRTSNIVDGYTLKLNNAQGEKIYAYGGYSKRQNAINNIVLIENNSKVSNVYGAKADAKDANSNTVKISDSSILGIIYGGRADVKNANSNAVEIDKSNVSGVIYGGFAANESNSLSNNVNIIDSSVKNVFGGYVEASKTATKWGTSNETDNAKNNTVTLINTTAENVYGGQGKTVSENKIFLDKAIISGNLSGASANSETVEGNELILIGADNRATSVSNLDIVRFGDENKISWLKNATFLKAESFSGENIELDVSNILLPDDFSEENLGEKMTLLDISTAENMSDFNLRDSVFSEASSFDISGFKSFDIDVNYTPMHHISVEDTKITDQILGKVNNIVFKNIPWLETSPLIEKDDNFDYENSTVNTANINFTNVDVLSKNDEMILVESFGNTANIVGDTYKIKTTLEGKGRAKIDDNKNLIFVIETMAKKDEPKIETEENITDDYDDGYDEPIEETQPKNEIKRDEIKPKEEVKKIEIMPKETEINEEVKEETKEEHASQNDNEQSIIKDETTNNEKKANVPIAPTLTTQTQTHNTVMSMEAAMIALSAAGDFVQNAMDGVAEGAGESADGVATYAAMGGGSSKTKTGSSVNANTWSAILALGQERKLQNGVFTYGGFFEYGKANYTIEPNNGMSGASKYTGGGVFVKWQNPYDVYFEGSIRAGKMNDSTSGILTDSSGNRYGYDVSSDYVGAHFGVGKIYKYANDNELDLYGKFFYTRRGGVSYEAGGFYDLDAVSSKVCKIGGRYGKNKVGWNSFIGLSYAYEFDGAAKGKADGYAIREACTAGGTASVEFGLRLKPSMTSKWKSDISLKAHTGRSKGFGGHISFAYLF